MTPSPGPRVLPILAAFSSDSSLLDQVPGLVEPILGRVPLRSPSFRFDQTDYYAASMGTPIWKQFLAADALMDADRLPSIKRATIAVETGLAESGRFAVQRPLNLDPGYLDGGKLVLASTKDHAHRLYLGEGIFGEVTLHFRHGNWECWPWTYPDYQLDATRAFFAEVRQHYRSLTKPLPA